MKGWLIALFTLVLGFSAGVSADEAKFELGQQYIKIDRPHEDKIVVKVFSVYCPYCYKYEKSVTPGMIASLPEGVKYEAWSLRTKGKYGEQANLVLSTLLGMDNQEGYKAAKMAYYKAIHDDKHEFASEDEFINFGLKAANVSPDVYKQNVDQPAAKALRERWEPSAEIAKIQGVPAFVVNGDYLVSTQKITSLPMFNQLIGFLLTQ